MTLTVQVERPSPSADAFVVAPFGTWTESKADTFFPAGKASLSATEKAGLSEVTSETRTIATAEGKLASGELEEGIVRQVRPGIFERNGRLYGADGGELASPARSGLRIRYNEPHISDNLADPSRLVSDRARLEETIRSGIDIPGREPGVRIFYETNFRPGYALKVITEEVPGGYYVRTFYPLGLRRAVSELFVYGLG